jgi:integrase
MSAGIRVRHRRDCAGKPCTCKPAYEAWAYDKRAGKKIRRTFSNLDEAKGWRHDAAAAVRKRTLSANHSRQTLRDAGDVYIAGMKTGTIIDRRGNRYKPSTIRSYEQALRVRVYPDLGAQRLSNVTRNDLQDLADRLLAHGLDPSTVHNALAPVRAVYRRAFKRGEVSINPTTGLELPKPQGKRDRIATPKEADSLIAATPDEHKALWATACYAGLRRGELQALPWETIELDKNLLRVWIAYDDEAGEFIETKSRNRRTVPIPKVLRSFLLAHRLRTGRSTGLVFGRSARKPFSTSSVWRRAHTAWRRAELAPISLHECRHTYASFMIAAGVNAKALSSYMGHSSIQITFDRYGHLMPGNEQEAAALLDTYLDRAGNSVECAPLMRQ